MQPFIISREKGGDRLHTITILAQISDDKFLAHQDNKMFTITLADILTCKYESMAKSVNQ